MSQYAIGTYADGRAITYDDVSRHFALQGAVVTVGDVAAWDGEGLVTWASPETRVWVLNTAQSASGSATPNGAASRKPGSAGRSLLIAGCVVGLVAFCGFVAALAGSARPSTAPASAFKASSPTGIATSSTAAPVQDPVGDRDASAPTAAPVASPKPKAAAAVAVPVAAVVAQPKLQSAPKPTASTAVIVYVTATGKKYHRAGCRYLAKSQIAMTLAQAKAAGYAP